MAYNYGLAPGTTHKVSPSGSSAASSTAYPTSTISQITSSKSFIMKEQGEIDVTRYLEDNPYIIERKIAKVNPVKFP